MDDALGDGVPLLVAQPPVPGGGADRAVPDMLGGRAVAGLLDPQVQGSDEPGKGDHRVGVAAGVGGEAVPGADEVCVGVLLAPSGAVQVDEEAVGAGAPSDVGNHHSRRVTRSFAASSTRARSPVSAPSVCSSSPARGWPPLLRTKAIWLMLLPIRASAVRRAASSSMAVSSCSLLCTAARPRAALRPAVARKRATVTPRWVAASVISAFSVSERRVVVLRARSLGLRLRRRGVRSGKAGMLRLGCSRSAGSSASPPVTGAPWCRLPGWSPCALARGPAGLPPPSWAGASAYDGP
uniref:Hypothical protein n=1 Tax=Streptomyces lividans TaxID=1916 RepID=A7TUT1_STRLI|nr:hypothical protein [Streptomyces lividans]